MNLIYISAILHCAAYPTEATAKDERALLRLAYLDYFNNFLTVAKFAEHYGLESETTALAVINLGRTIHENYATGEPSQ